MLTERLQAVWTDWLKEADDLMQRLHEETAALTLRDDERLARLQPDIENALLRLRDLDRDAAALALFAAKHLDAQPTLPALLRALGKEESQQLHSLANRVTVASRRVHEVRMKNQALAQARHGRLNAGAPGEEVRAQAA